MNPKISIIIPTKNEESILEITLTKLSSLTIPHEIIISDGNSTDATPAIASMHGARVVEYTGEKRQTIGQGRNDGAKIATGEFLVFLDADCSVTEPTSFFEKALAHFERDPKLVALTAGLRVLPQYETFADRLGYGLLGALVRFQNNVLHRGEAPGEFQMMRRDTFEKLGGFRADLVTREDADMFLRLSRVGRTRFATDLTVFHTGRRPHAVGWPALLWTWTINALSYSLFNKSVSEEWKVIR